MIKSVFPRLFGQYKEGQIIGGKWTVSAGDGTVTSQTAESHNDVTLANVGSGLYTLTVPKCRKLFLVNGYVTNPDSDDPTDMRGFWVDEELGGVDAANGKIYFATTQMEEGGTAFALAVPPNGSEIHILVYLDK